MSISVDVRPHKVVGGPGFSLEIAAHYYNNTRSDITFSPSRAECEIVGPSGKVVEKLSSDAEPNLCDTIRLESRQSHDFELRRFTSHDLSHGSHKLRVRVADSVSESDIQI